MATKMRYQNPVVTDTVLLQQRAYNSNNLADFHDVEKVEIYFFDPNAHTEENPEGKTLVQTIDAADVVHTSTGLYQVSVDLVDTKYVIGNYVDTWYVHIGESETTATVENQWQVYPDLWYTSPLPIVYDFAFTFRPNKIRQGAKQYLIIDITPNVPKASDLQRYYENIAIVSPITISIEQACGDCLPQEEDLRLIVDNDSVDLREKTVGYYFLDTTEMNTGIYNVWFQMNFGENLYISPKQQIQIY